MKFVLINVKLLIMPSHDAVSPCITVKIRNTGISFSAVTSIRETPLITASSFSYRH